MFKKRFIISVSLFITFLVLTSTIKNKTRVLEKKISNLNAKILLKKKDFNETQLDFYYLTSPAEIEKKIKLIGFNTYQAIKFSNLYSNISDFSIIDNKISNLNKFDETKK